MDHGWTVLIATHAVAATLALVLGGANLVRRPRGDAVHRVIGRLWLGFMYFAATSSFWIQQLRPEIIGGTFSTFGDDGYVEAVYFRSEDEARAHERMDLPDDLRAVLEEQNELMDDVTYFDLREPMLLSARS